MADSTIDDSQNYSEHECRVCRTGGEEGRPLYTPCKCSGSIGLVHQDCLEAWLTHSKKDSCELCGAKYQFSPQYAENTPAVIPPIIFLKSFFKLTFLKAIPMTFRVVLALFIWLVLVPIGTTVAYCTCMRRSSYVSWKMDFNALSSTVCYGLVIDAVMALSMLIIVSHVQYRPFFS
jgi:E3 ubiquitin-protein ligase DOA10